MKEVTLKLHHIDEKLPEKSGFYLAIIKHDDNTFRDITMLPYSVKHKKFNTFDHLLPLWELDNVKYWAEVEIIKELFKGKE